MEQRQLNTITIDGCLVIMSESELSDKLVKTESTRPLLVGPNQAVMCPVYTRKENSNPGDELLVEIPIHSLHSLGGLYDANGENIKLLLINYR